MNNITTDPFVVVKATDNTELANRNEKVRYATSIITVNERAYPFAHVFENKQDAQKCTQQIIHELRELATNDAVTHESYNAEPSSEALDTDRSVINSDIEAPAALVIPAADDSCTEVSTMAASINTERSTALVARSSSESAVIDSQKTADDELMRSFIPFISGNREMDNGVSFAKKAAEGQISSYTLMEKIVNTIPMKMVGEVLYYYDKALYHYIQLTDSDSKRLIMLLCRDDVKEYGSPAIVRAVHEFITMNPDIVSSIHDTIHPDYLGFRNGILDLRTFRFLAPTHDIFITNIVDDYYEPGFTGQCPNFDAFLYGCYDGNSALINRVWEAIGYILTDDINAKCFFLLLGPGDSGKSLLIKLICSFFRDDAVCPLTINQFGERFGLSLANGKKLITCADLPKNPLTDSAVAIIKCLTGGDSISYEQKYKDMARFINTAKLIFASNFPITLVSQDQAFINRIVEIPFLHSVPKERQIKDLYETLHKEKHAIIHRALIAYRYLRSRKYIFSGEEYMSSVKEQTVMPTVTAESVIRQFFEDCCCTSDNSSFVTTEVLHAAYTNYCARFNYAVLAKEQFSKIFKQLFGERFSSVKRQAADGSRPRGYAGLSLRK